MFDGIFSLGSLIISYSGSSLAAAISSATCKVNGQFVPCSDALGFLAIIFSILAPIFIFLMLIGIAVGVLMIISWWKIFKKAGRPGWPAIVPIYNNVVMLQIVGMSPWLILLAFIPFAGQLALFIVMIFMNIKLAKAFGKDGGFAVGLILLPVVFVPILAFGKAQFVGITPAAPTTPTTPSTSPVAPQNPPIAPVTPSTTQDTPVPPVGPTGTV